MTCWAKLDDELRKWRENGREASFWWRDDDAICATDKLDRLLALNSRWSVPLSLAVIPGLADESLTTALNTFPDVAVLQHGFRHINHATGDDKKSELGVHRPVDQIMHDLEKGREINDTLFGINALPVLVPPWNRIDDSVVAALPRLGYIGISTFRARNYCEAAAGVAQVNAHVDIIDWSGNRGYRGNEAVLGDLCAHLAERRAGAVDATEPTGLLTHHLDHDEPCWAFIEKLLERTTAGEGKSWKSAEELFAAKVNSR